MQVHIVFAGQRLRPGDTNGGSARLSNLLGQIWQDVDEWVHGVKAVERGVQNQIRAVAHFVDDSQHALTYQTGVQGEALGWGDVSLFHVAFEGFPIAADLGNVGGECKIVARLGSGLELGQGCTRRRRRICNRLFEATVSAQKSARGPAMLLYILQQVTQGHQIRDP